MAKTNKKVGLGTKILNRKDVTLNKAGGIAFVPEAKTELFLRAASLLPGEDKFYASGDEAMGEFVAAIGSVMVEDPEFVLKLALFAREDMHLRHAPLHMLANYARFNSVVRGEAERGRADGSIKQVVDRLDAVRAPSHYVAATIQRADEIPELIAIAQKMNSEDKVWTGKLPMVLKRGISLAFGKFDTYQYGKYGRARDAEVSMKDAICMVRPKPKDAEQKALYDMIAHRKVPIPETWEQYIMAHGSTRETWTHIVPKMGYMALIRNLRNFVEKGLDRETIETIASRLRDPREVERSKQFPFRFYSAVRALEQTHGGDPFAQSTLMASVKDALETSTCNVPKLPGRTAVFVDMSGSMGSPLSAKSSLTYRNVAALYGAIFNKIADNSVVGVFATTLEVVPRKTTDILATMDKIERARVGGSTNAYLAFQWLYREKIDADRVFLLSDMQCWDSMSGYGMESVAKPFLQWQRSVSPNAYLYSVDLSGYGTTQFPKDAKNVVTLAGWSEKIFQFASLYEMTKEDMLAAVNAKTPMRTMYDLAREQGED